LTLTFFFACAVTLTFIFLPQVTFLIICFLYYISIKFATEDLPGLDTITTACRTLNNAWINSSGSIQQFYELSNTSENSAFTTDIFHHAAVILISKLFHHCGAKI